MSAKTLVKPETLDQCSYDEVPYVSLPFRHTHPDRLAAVASLLGVTTRPVEKCRVLEIGCASGGNLIPVAYAFPESQFLGIDLSERQVADGRATVQALGLSNIEIRHQNVLDFPADAGEFDYIITHGVYSWIPKEAQDKIMEICQKHLSPNGVAYISYNTLPGWHFRGAVRELMVYHANDPGADPETKARLGRAKGIVDLFSQSLNKAASQASTQGPFAIKSLELVLGEESTSLKSQRDDYILHEHLSENNEAIYFWQFMERCDKFGLQYLCESEFSTTRTTNFAPDLQEALKAATTDPIRLEQYMDYVRNRTFRQTIVCRKDKDLNRQIDINAIRKFYIASPAAPSAPVNLQTRESQSFTWMGCTFTTSNPLVKAVFQILGENWPRAVAFDELLSSARARVASIEVKAGDAVEREVQVLCQDLLLGYGINILSFRTAPDRFTTELSELPEALATARHQAITSNQVTTMLHDNTEVDPFNSQLLRLLDGTNNKEQLIDKLAELVARDVLVVHQNGVQLKEGQELKTLLAYYVDERLPVLVKQALLRR